MRSVSTTALVPVPAPTGKLPGAEVRAADVLAERLVAGRVGHASNGPRGRAGRDAEGAPAPNLREGKPVPGPSEWNAIARRASTLRLRGSGGSIGR